MSIASIIVLIVIIALSVIGVLTASEPIEDAFAIRIAMAGFPLQPLATKTGPHPSESEIRHAKLRAQSPKGRLDKRALGV